MAGKATTGTESETSGRGVSWSREALELVYRDHSGAVYAAARGFCGSRVAGDVTVEVFLHLWRHPEQQDSARGSLRTWLLTVTHDISAVDRSLFDQPLGMLSRDERDAIVTAYYGGCTYREAAVALGLDEGTVKSRLRAGLHHLRKASVSYEGLVAALDSRQVVAQAQGIIMQREGSSADEAYRALLQSSEELGVSLPVCAELFVSTADDEIAIPDSVDR